VEAGATVTRALVANDITIGKNATVGDEKSEHIELVAKKVKGVE
jgi:glucose-1-phosphate adenylyltransferase